MKLYCLLVLLIGCTALGAEDLSKPKQNFLEDLDVQIGALQKARTCAAAAQSKGALKKCRQELDQSREEYRQRLQERRKTRIDQQVKKLQEEKRKFEEKKQ